jgi:hypothetical protein
MPLSAPAPREHLHTRTVECRGYRREDGLWEVEGHLRDTKTYDFENRQRGRVAAGEAVHDMWLRLTYDESMVIHDAEASTDDSPFATCPGITPVYAKLKGMKIAPGFTMRVRDMFGGVAGCTHLTELLGPVATTAFQTLAAKRQQEPQNQAEGQRKPPRILDTCHALASDGPVVREIWPEFYTGT